MLLHRRYAPLERFEVPVQEVEKTDFIGVNVKDRASSAEFYAQQLGLIPNPNASEEWPEFETSNVGFVLSHAGAEGRRRPPPGVQHRAPRGGRREVDGAPPERGCRVRVSRGLRFGRLPHGVLLGSGRQLADPAPPLRAVPRRLAPLMQIEQVDFVSVPTRDSARAVAWYSEVLGLPVSEFTDGEVETPNVTLAFWSPEDRRRAVPAELRRHRRCASQNVEAAVEEARRHGAEVIGIEDSGVCHMGFVKDPDGNVLILHRRYAAPWIGQRRSHALRGAADAVDERRALALHRPPGLRPGLLRDRRLGRQARRARGDAGRRRRRDGGRRRGRDLDRRKRPPEGITFEPFAGPRAARGARRHRREVRRAQRGRLGARAARPGSEGRRARAAALGSDRQLGRRAGRSSSACS